MVYHSLPYHVMVYHIIPYGIPWYTWMTSHGTHLKKITFVMFLLIQNNNVRISSHMYCSHIPTQAVMLIRSTTYMLTLYCILNVICIIDSRQSVLIAYFLTRIAYPNKG